MPLRLTVLFLGKLQDQPGFSLANLNTWSRALVSLFTSKVLQNVALHWLSKPEARSKEAWKEKTKTKEMESEMK